MEMAGNGNYINNGGYNTKYSQFCNDYDYDYNDDNNQLDRLLSAAKCRSRLAISSASSSSSAIRTPSPPPISGAGFIEHPVSKLDTLAGVAIKYGVEVADIKKMNGLVTDLQMFALKSLQIPLPGRFPPSCSLSNGSGTPGQNGFGDTAVHRGNSDLLDSFQSLRLKSSLRKVSPAMSSLQGFYGLQPVDSGIASDGCEMALYVKGDSSLLQNSQYLEPSPSCNRPLSLQRKSRSLVNAFSYENNEPSSNWSLGDATGTDPEKSNEKLFRRRQKSVADLTSSSREMLLREETNSGGVFSAITGKGLALRSKAATRTSTFNDSEAGGGSPVADSGLDEFSTVRKSTSASSLQDQESPSIWPVSWKPDLQSLSGAAITRPIFDGLPRAVTSRRNKAALD
ncbi:hypothetical protein Tsubulata_015813 [Turnera subulata]|uniref:LysM domain-containing protein n=1 Tax=Turnera subulata TaxID=218843 RepID=A0A9Q0IXU5_9ROSI|nr:hypothetical protein Tsubulata_015813 [Turnera subulata]